MPSSYGRSRRTLFAAVLLVTAACASVPLPEREGVTLYRRKCGGCHRPYAPEERTVAQWNKRLPEMARRAKLTPEELEIVRRYLELEPMPSHEPLAASRGPSR